MASLLPSPRRFLHPSTWSQQWPRVPIGYRPHPSQCKPAFIITNLYCTHKYLLRCPRHDPWLTVAPSVLVYFPQAWLTRPVMSEGREVASTCAEAASIVNMVTFDTAAVPSHPPVTTTESSSSIAQDLLKSHQDWLYDYSKDTTIKVNPLYLIRKSASCRVSSNISEPWCCCSLWQLVVTHKQHPNGRGPADVATSGGGQGVGPGPAAPRKGDTGGLLILTTTEDVAALRVKLPGLREVRQRTQSGAVCEKQLHRAGLSWGSASSCHHYNWNCVHCL